VYGCWEHKTWQGFRNPAEGHRSYISTSGVVSVNPKNHHFLLAYLHYDCYSNFTTNANN
jgi:hypothetical protein